MQKKSKKWLIILIIFVLLLLLIGGAFWLKNRPASDGQNSLLPFSNQPQLVGRPDQAAGSTVRVIDQPYVTLHYNTVASDPAHFELTLHTIPLSVGGASYQLSFTGQTFTGDFDLMDFPFQTALNLPPSKNEVGFITLKLDAVEPYQTYQQFNYYAEFSQKTLASDDGYFTLKNDQLDHAKNLILTTTAGLPTELPNSKTVMSLTKNINDQTYNFPLAYQLSYNRDEVTPHSTEVSFITDLPLDESLQPQILAYDQATMTWFPLETQGAQTTFTATSDRIYDLYVLSI